MMTNGSTEVYLGLGSNQGDRNLYIEKALSMLDSTPGVRVEEESSVIETEPWGFESENCFLNCAVRVNVDSTVNPESLLETCKEIETELGRNEVMEYREDGSRVYHSRNIDIDILLYGDRRISSERLTVPHPLMAERDFVMVPLRQIATDGIENAFPEIFRPALKTRAK